MNDAGVIVLGEFSVVSMPARHFFSDLSCVIELDKKLTGVFTKNSDWSNLIRLFGGPYESFKPFTLNTRTLIRNLLNFRFRI